MKRKSTFPYAICKEMEHLVLWYLAILKGHPKTFAYRAICVNVIINLIRGLTTSDTIERNGSLMNATLLNRLTDNVERVKKSIELMSAMKAMSAKREMQFFELLIPIDMRIKVWRYRIGKNTVPLRLS